MNIIIRSIPHQSHRYPTCGDWWWEGEDLHIRVSEEMSYHSQSLVALHEMAEAMMCSANGVTQKQVDDFDMGYEKNRQEGDDSEPGDHKDAPYHDQHKLATAVELIVANQMGVEWEDHERNISQLFE